MQMYIDNTIMEKRQCLTNKKVNLAATEIVFSKNTYLLLQACQQLCDIERSSALS